MRILKFMFWANVFAVCPGAVLSVAFSWFNDHPATLAAWRVSLCDWQLVLWSCFGFVWFTVACACLNGSASGTVESDTEEVGCSPGWTQGNDVRIHPVSGNMMSCGVDCDGNMSGAYNPPTYD